ncbi:MAG: transposase [Candidatus Bathyarchaeia archaeon]
MSSLRDWEGYNEAIVKRGLILLIKLLAVVHAYVLPYRQLEGFICGLSQHVDGVKAPDYTTIWWRVAKMKVNLESSVALDRDLLWRWTPAA